MSKRSLTFLVCVSVIIIGVFAVSRESLGRWLPYLLIAACPLMHLFMHKGHGEHTEGGENGHGGKDTSHR